MTPIKPNHRIVLDSARACVLSYMNFESRDFLMKCREWGFENIEYHVSAGVEVLCMTKSGVIHICPRGTDSIADWIMNLFFTRSRLPFAGKVHKGFLRQADSIHFFVEKYISKFRGGRTISIKGHSLGAAMALNIAWMYRSQVSSVVLFGCPRNGDAEFAKNYNEVLGDVTLRFTHNNDPVPWVPFKWMGFVHVWHRHHLDFNGKLHAFYRPTLSDKLKECLNGRLRSIAKLQFFDGITDHSMQKHYHPLIERHFSHGYK